MPLVPRNAAHEAARGRRGYSEKRVDRICDLMDDYFEKNEHHANLVCGSTFAVDREPIETACREHVIQHYGVTGLEWLLWPLIQALITWTVHRILDRWWDQPGAAGSVG